MMRVPKKTKSKDTHKQRERSAAWWDIRVLWNRAATRRLVMGTILIVALTGVAYFHSLKAEYIWDDQAVTENPLLKTVDGLWLIWSAPEENYPHESHYWPLTYTTFWFEQRLWGIRPFGYHLVNLLLHIVNSLLVWLLFRRLKMPWAYIAALLFALHPVHVESVAWVIERKDVLSGLFYLLAFLSYLRFEREGKHRIYILALVLFVCAMLSKGVAITLPVALVIAVWWREGTFRRRDIVRVLPFFAIAVIIGIFDVAFIYTTNEIHPHGLSFIDRLLIVSRSIWFYAQKMVLPTPLMAIYPKWEIDAHNAVFYLYPAALIVFLAALWALRHRISRGPLAAVLFFCVTLGPTLGMFDFNFMIASYVADRFQYLASIGLIALAASLLFKVISQSGSIRRIGYGLTIVLCALSAFLTFQHCKVFKNYYTLFEHNVDKNPRAWAAFNNLGFLHLNKNELEEAEPYFRKALEIWPEYPKANNNMGVLYTKCGKYEKAVEHFDLALKFSPHYPRVLNNKGTALYWLGKYGQAIDVYDHALERWPNYAVALFNKGLALAGLNRFDEAIECYDRTLREDPEYTDACFNKGLALSNLGKFDEAIGCFTRTITLQQDHIAAYLCLGKTYEIQKNYEQSIVWRSKALELDPTNPRIHFELANSYFKVENFDKAMEHYGIAQRLRAENTAPAEGVRK